MTKLTSIAILVTAAACGGSDSGPVSPAFAQDVCEQICDRDVECDATTDRAACITSCADDIDGGGFRRDAVEAIADCVSNLSCTTDEDVCIGECEPTSTHESFETTCRSKLTECSVGASTVDAVCETNAVAGSESTGLTCMLTPEVMSELTECLDGACAAINDCFNAVLAKYNVDF
jgi:hypothetical protein